MRHFGKPFTKRIPLKRDKVMVVQADDPKHDRGLLIELVGKGGYDVAYWYDQPEKVFPAEVRIDGKTITKDGRIVHIGYHPELAEPSSFGQTEESGFDPYSRGFVDTTVLGTALATSGVVGAFVGVATTAVGIGAYELLRGREVNKDKAALLYAGMAAAFFFGVPGAVLKAEGRV